MINDTAIILRSTPYSDFNRLLRPQYTKLYNMDLINLGTT